MSVLPVILWFRRDLRLADHPALHAAAAAATSTGAPLLPIFIWEPSLFDGPRTSRNRTWYLRESLRELSEALRARGSMLLELHGPARDALSELVAALRVTHSDEPSAVQIFMTRDHTPFARTRDRDVAAALAPLNVTLHAKRGQVVVEPEELLTGAGTPYGVFTPYYRRWSDVVDARGEMPLAAPATLPPAPHVAPLRVVDQAALDVASRPTATTTLLAAPGERAARAAADAWFKRGSALTEYSARRDSLADVEGTSHLSAALHLGLISSNELVSRIVSGRGAGGAASDGASNWVRQLAWRDFYAQVLWHAPHAARAAWRPAYDAVRWDKNPEGFAAWCEGRTGYPVVDAAMRQLMQSGFMHNRARMITASFLTKDLLIDWRMGEAHFLRHLVDGDIAANNGGWQWAASTGTDAQPYFRIFNPVKQSERFDPAGAYVRRWVPELAALSNAAIHEPWAHPLELARVGVVLGRDYPEPIVDHAAARQRTLTAYAAAVRRGPVDESGR